MESELVLPYGPAPTISFILHELAMFALLALCLFHATSRGAAHVSYLLGGVLFGLLVEYINVNAGLNYSYGQFWFMLGPTPEPGVVPANIPVNIGIGWGIIIYTARLFSDSLGLPIWSRPAMDALLALNVDLSMDVVAYRLNMWHWGWEFLPAQPNPLTSEWFGVPYANFVGWLLVVCFYSAFARLLLRRLAKQHRPGQQWLRLIVSTVVAIILAQASLFVSLLLLPGWFARLRDALLPFPIAAYAILMLVIIIVFIGMVIIGFRRRQAPIEPDDHPVIWLTPLYFHIYFTIWLFAAGFHQETFWLLGVSVINAALGIGIHQWGRFVRKKSQVPVTTGAVMER